MESWWFPRTSQRLPVGVENGSNNFMLAFTWLDGSLHTHACSFCTIMMTERICWYKPLWIRRGEFFQKVYLEEWEKSGRRAKPCLRRRQVVPDCYSHKRLKEYKRPKLPPRGMATLGPCQQSICSRATRTPRATCPPQGKILLLPAKQRDRQVRR